MPDSASMTSSLNQALSNVTAFKGCSSETLKRIEQEGEDCIWYWALTGLNLLY